jgi:hypothetical protein
VAWLWSSPVHWTVNVTLRDTLRYRSIIIIIKLPNSINAIGPATHRGGRTVCWGGTLCCSTASTTKFAIPYISGHKASQHATILHARYTPPNSGGTWSLKQCRSRSMMLQAATAEGSGACANLACMHVLKGSACVSKLWTPTCCM